MQKYEKYRGFLSENFQFLEMKFSIYWNRRVFVMRNNSHLLIITTFLCLILLISQTVASEQQPIASYNKQFSLFPTFPSPILFIFQMNTSHLPILFFFYFLFFLFSLTFLFISQTAISQQHTLQEPHFFISHSHILPITATYMYLNYFTIFLHPTFLISLSVV